MGKVHSLASGNAAVARLTFTEEEVEGLKAKLLELTRAEVIVRGTKRDENGKCIYVSVPDQGIQLAATVKALEFAVGRPTQKLEVQTNAGSPSLPLTQRALVELMAANPEMTKRVLDAVTEAAKNAQAVPVQAVASEKPALPPESLAEGSQS